MKFKIRKKGFIGIASSILVLLIVGIFVFSFPLFSSPASAPLPASTLKIWSGTNNITDFLVGGNTIFTDTSAIVWINVSAPTTIKINDFQIYAQDNINVPIELHEWVNMSHNVENTTIVILWSNTSSPNGTWQNFTFENITKANLTQYFYDLNKSQFPYTMSANIQKQIRMKLYFPANQIFKFNISVNATVLGVNFLATLDPWANATFPFCKNLNITYLNPQTVWTNQRVLQNITNIGFNNSYELRIYNQSCTGTGGLPQEYKVLYNNSLTHALLEFNMSTTGNGTPSYSVFYGTRTVENPNYAFLSGNVSLNSRHNYTDTANVSAYSGSLSNSDYAIAGCPTLNMVRFSNAAQFFEVNSTRQTFLSDNYTVIGMKLVRGSTTSTSVMISYTNSSGNLQRLGNFTLPAANPSVSPTVPVTTLGFDVLSQNSGFSVNKFNTSVYVKANNTCAAAGGDAQTNLFVYMPSEMFISGGGLRFEGAANWIGVANDIRGSNVTNETFWAQNQGSALFNTYTESLGLIQQGTESSNATPTVQPFFSSNLTSISNNSAYDTADDWFNVTMGGCSSWCNVSLQINLTANTFSNVSMTNNGTGTFYYRFGGGLPAGIFNVTFVSNNSDGNSNISGTWIQQVYKSSPVLGLATNTTNLVFYERFNINSTGSGLGQLKMFDSTMNHETARIIAAANTQQWLNTSGYLGSSGFNGGLSNNIRYNASDVQNSTNITTGITVSAWIKVDGVSGAGDAQGCIVAFSNTSFEADLAIIGTQYCLAVQNSNSNPLVEFYVYNSSNNQIRSGNYILPMGSFVHVAGRFNRTHSSVFINGVETNRSTSFLSTTTIQPIAKGGCSAGACGNDPSVMISEVSRNTFLRVDEVSVINSSLTDTQINSSARLGIVIDRIVQPLPVPLNTTGFTLVGDSSNTITLFRNNTNIAGGLVPSNNVSLAEGIYNYTVFYPESQNYTQTVLTKMVYIESSQNEAIWYSANVTAPARYDGTTMTQFNITVGTNNGTVILQTNITGSMVNFTMQNNTSPTNFFYQAVIPASVGYNLTGRIYTFSSAGAVSNSSYFIYNFSSDKGIAVTVISNSTQNGTINTTGLVGYWRFEGLDLNDSSGYGNYGNVTGVNATAVEGKFGRGLFFDGRDDFAVTQYADNLNTSTNFTVSAWVRVNGTQSQKRIIAKTDTSPNRYNWFINIAGAGNNNFEFRIMVDGSGSVASAVGTKNIADNEWHHVVGMNIEQGRVDLYTDGVLDATTAYSAARGLGNSPIRIGCDHGGNCFNGTVDEVMIWNRSLTASEILMLNGSRAVYGNTTLILQQPESTYPDNLTYRMFRNTTIISNSYGLVGYWKLDNDTRDSSGFGNSGNMGGANATYQNGRFGLGLQFDSIDDSVDFGRSETLNLTGKNNITISLWLRGSTTVNQGFIDPISWGHNGSHGFVLQNGAFLIGTGTTIPSCGTHGNLTDNLWHLITVVKNSATGCVTYVDGVQNVSNSAMTADIVLRTDWRMTAGRDPFLDRLLNGSLDEIRVYNRSLSASEVIELYNQTRPRGAEYYISNTTGNANYSSQESPVVPLTIDPAILGGNLYINNTQANQTYTYPNATNITGTIGSRINNEGTLYVMRNLTSVGVLLGSNFAMNESLLGASLYNVSVNWIGYNYTFTNISNNLVVNQGTPEIRIYLNGSYASANNTNLTYPNATSVNGTIIRFLGNFNASLFRNNTLVTGMINENLTLAASFWNYTAYWAGDENYSANSTQLNLTMLKGTITLNLYINGTQASQTWVYPNSTNITGIGSPSRVNNEGTIQLFRNSTITGIAVNNNLIMNETLLGVSLYNFSLQFASQNYSSANISLNLTITQATPQIIIYLNRSYATANNTNLTFPNATIINATVVRFVSNINATLFRNLTIITSIQNENLTLGVSFWNYTGYWAGDQNYTANSTTLNLTILADLSAPVFSNFGINNTEVDLDLNQSVDISVIVREPSYSLNSTIIQFLYPNRTAYNFTAIRSGTTDEFNVSIVFNFTQASQIGEINFTVYANDSSGNTNSTAFIIRMQTSKINTTAILYSANFTRSASAFVIGSAKEYLDTYFNVSIIFNASGTANITKNMNITLLGLLLANQSGTGQFENYSLANDTFANVGYNLINNHINFSVPFNQTQSRMLNLLTRVSRAFNFSTYWRDGYDIYYFNASNISNSTSTWFYLTIPLNNSYDPSSKNAQINLCNARIVFNDSYPTCNGSYVAPFVLTQTNKGNNNIGSRIFNFEPVASLDNKNMTFNASFSEFMLRIQYVSGEQQSGGGGGGGGFGTTTTTTLQLQTVTPIDLSQAPSVKLLFYFLAGSMVLIAVMEYDKRKKKKPSKSSLLDMEL